MKGLKAYIVLLVLLFGFIAFVEFTKEQPVNWTKTYNENDKIPYGTFIFHDQLPKLFPDYSVENITKSPYEFFENIYDAYKDDYLKSGTYIHVEEFANIDEVSGKELIKFAAKGNTVFISSINIPTVILDTLEIESGIKYNLKGNGNLQLVYSTFKNDTVSFKQGLSNSYFKTFKEETATVLGRQKFGDSLYTNFIKIKFKKGEFLLHTQPIVFTNYSLLKAPHYKKHTEAILSYLPDNTIFYKAKDKEDANLSNSKLRFIFSKPALRYAWYLGLTSLVLFLIFNAKRKQRIIKEIKPLENTTVAFTKTIGNLYYETKDHDNLIDKKITYFLEYIRRVYYLDTQILNDKFVTSLALKTNKPKKEIKILVDKIAILRAKPDCTEQDLLDLNTLIEDFYTH